MEQRYSYQAREGTALRMSDQLFMRRLSRSEARLTPIDWIVAALATLLWRVYSILVAHPGLRSLVRRARRALAGARGAKSAGGPS